MKTFKIILGVIIIIIVIGFSEQIGKKFGKSVAINNYEGEKESELHEMLLKKSKELNSQLPMMIDEETRADITIVQGATMYYKYTMINVDADKINSAKFENEIKSNLIKNICSTEDTVTTLKAGVQYSFIYHDKNGNPIAIITIPYDKCHSDDG